MFTLIFDDGSQFTLTSLEVRRLLASEPPFLRQVRESGRIVVHAASFEIVCPLGAGNDLLAAAGIPTFMHA